ncbi:MAG: sensor histidine kinase [Coriobacteriia bacterium]|nr:sensor histidine kinase [Coriobacteriia bacterium]
MTPNDDLLNFVTAVSGEAYLKVEETLGDGYVRLRISEAERRQAKHDIRSVEDIVVELLRNSRDAHAGRLFIATGREGDTRSMTLIDDGVGVPTAMHDHVFEPRVTSKLDTMVMDRWGVHGRGMALFSIRSNATEARIATSELHKGAAVVVVTDSTALAERADQSTWPMLERDDSGSLKVARGPHNIVRRVVEFAVEHPGIEVYLGTPTEILATMWALARTELDASELLFCDDVTRLPVWQRPSAAGDAAELVDIAHSLGLEVSDRTAHRVIADGLPRLKQVLVLAGGSAPVVPETSGPDIYKDRRGLKLHHTDIAQFRRELEAAFDSIAERYYLHLKCEPKITVGKDDIRVRFEVEKED